MAPETLKETSAPHRHSRDRPYVLSMPTSDGPVGPFPEGTDPETYDRLRRRVLWTMPSGLYVVGSRDGDRRNAMTLNWSKRG